MPRKRVLGKVLSAGKKYVEWSVKEVFSAVLLAVGESILTLNLIYVYSVRERSIVEQEEKY